MEIAIVLIIVLVVIAATYGGLYNGLVHAGQKVKEAWSGIDVQLKRRYDLIPNLINTVKGFAAQEQNVLMSVTQARAAAIAVPDGAVTQQAQAENALSGTLKSIFALSENYPDLKSNQNFLELQNALSETEDQIAASRRIYNGNVTVLNTKVQSFPSNIVAGMHKFKEADFFELAETEKEGVQATPQVNF
ncbi:MAG TPA: LemA family protein [Candidatus Gracilibacteria bacterium]